MNLEEHQLDNQHSIFVGEVSFHLIPDETGFQALWDTHPSAFPLINMFGRRVPTPRWQQAYGHDYRYSGQVNSALPVEPILQPFLDWGCREIDPGFNGILVNWYDGQLGHYIGPHKDSTLDLIEGAPIVTISLGEERVLTLQRTKSSPGKDFPVRNGTVIVIPYSTNKCWLHSVPKASAFTGRRISVTLRGFIGRRG
jgi:alkylated DNA repair dioxygenase AlkB